MVSYQRRMGSVAPGPMESAAPYINYADRIRGRRAAKSKLAEDRRLAEEERKSDEAQRVIKNKLDQQNFGLKERQVAISEGNLDLNKSKFDTEKSVYSTEQSQLPLSKRSMPKGKADQIISGYRDIDQKYGTDIVGAMSDTFQYISENAENRPFLEVFGGVKEKTAQNKESLISALQQQKQNAKTQEAMINLDRVISAVNDGSFADRLFPGVSSATKDKEKPSLQDRKYADNLATQNFSAKYGVDVGRPLTSEEKNKAQQEASQMGLNVYFDEDDPEVVDNPGFFTGDTVTPMWAISGVVPSGQKSGSNVDMMGLSGPQVTALTAPTGSMGGQVERRPIMGGKPQITLPDNITKTSEALKYLTTQGMTEQDAVNWLRQEMQSNR